MSTELKEEWKVVTENVQGIYQISNFGNVRRFDKKLSKLIKITPMMSDMKNRKTIQMYFCSYDGDRPHKHYIKMLVAKIFLPNPNNFNDVECLDGNYKNLRVDNMKWMADPRKDLWQGKFTNNALKN